MSEYSATDCQRVRKQTLDYTSDCRTETRTRRTEDTLWSLESGDYKLCFSGGLTITVNNCSEGLCPSLRGSDGEAGGNVA